jgi:hypothetical protein
VSLILFITVSFLFVIIIIVIMSLSGIETKDCHPAPRSKRKRRQLQQANRASLSVRVITHKLTQNHAGMKDQRHLNSQATFRLVPGTDTTIFRDGNSTDQNTPLLEIFYRYASLNDGDTF